MIELIIALIVFTIAYSFGYVFFRRFRKNQINDPSKKGFFNNKYIFETIPSTFPTLGIFCTALGITMGIWNFNTDDIQNSMPELLNGLKLAFLATMLGIVGMIIFQKVAAVIQREIDDVNQNVVNESNELGALNVIIKKLNESTERNDINTKLLVDAIRGMNETIGSNSSNLENILKNELTKVCEVVTSMSVDIKDSIERNYNVELLSIGKSDEIIASLKDNQTEMSKKFDTFSVLLAKNNTEALVEVMKNVTETFSQQMNQIIEKLVKENFDALNNSVLNMVSWQEENKTQIQTLSDGYTSLTSNFEKNAVLLTDITNSVNGLVGDSSKLNELVLIMSEALMDDNNFTQTTKKLVHTIEMIEKSTEDFSNTTDKLNEWVNKEKNFNDSVELLIDKLEEFRDLNSDVWSRYRNEMDSAVGIIEKTSLTISKELSAIDDEFYNRLHTTLENLDMCIQRAIVKYEK
ncbi:MotA/TolQ/ExbB proton channel family [Myroides sp. A21]|uniref:MotA/TolQ/ExbB proton channel family protein n=1 Tax=Myroides sp. A21 TaxID=1583100 RepID=UPI00057D8DF7|nr:MotA/TolQ/ExbB proton channel family protein [Myroides sp. A21]AJA69892.1 MotA/TolQ/ExbB proton channel family [Myroides sp. A21]